MAFKRVHDHRFECTLLYRREPSWGMGGSERRLRASDDRFKTGQWATMTHGSGAVHPHSRRSCLAVQPHQGSTEGSLHSRISCVSALASEEMGDAASGNSGSLERSGERSKREGGVSVTQNQARGRGVVYVLRGTTEQ